MCLVSCNDWDKRGDDSGMVDCVCRFGRDGLMVLLFWLLLRNAGVCLKFQWKGY